MTSRLFSPFTLRSLELDNCQSAWGPDADRRAKLLTYLAVEGSFLLIHRIRRYWTTACQKCSLKSQCTTGPERRIPRWEHEHLLEAVQQRLMQTHRPWK
jgi:hypothetical protein